MDRGGLANQAEQKRVAGHVWIPVKEDDFFFIFRVRDRSDQIPDP